ncbi:MAG: hypothetical protein GWP09_01905 [Nitrospiraceae bacterium]|nr:hypothetical protein [Nitrospiraceae bacterium]
MRKIISKKSVSSLSYLFFVLIFILSLLILQSSHPHLKNSFSLGFFSLITKTNPANQTTSLISPNKIYSEKNTTIRVYFCPEDNCETEISSLLLSSVSSKCAFYDLSDKKIISIIKKTNTAVIMDKTNYERDLKKGIIHKSNINIRPILDDSIMHNKFCIINGTTIITGSTNPTYTGLFKNNNNIIIIKSLLLSKNYLTEFNLIKKSKNITSYKSKSPFEYHIIKTPSGTISNYFCHTNECPMVILNVLKTAKKSVFFMTFSFTDRQIAKELITLHLLGLNISGVFEKREINKYSTYKTLKRNNIIVCNDTNPNTMHNKVFIIDKKIVITGSYNPSNNAAHHNYENIIIINNTNITSKYLKEFTKIYHNSMCR